MICDLSVWNIYMNLKNDMIRWEKNNEWMDGTTEGIYEDDVICCIDYVFVSS